MEFSCLVLIILSRTSNGFKNQSRKKKKITLKIIYKLIIDSSESYFEITSLFTFSLSFQGPQCMKFSSIRGRTVAAWRA
jgi:hypothetical protein